MRFWLSLAIVAATADFAYAQPEFVVHSTDANGRTGRLSSISNGWAISLSDGSSVKAGHLIALRQKGIALPPTPLDRAHVAFVNGDVWPGQVVAIEGDQVRFQFDGRSSDLRFSLATVSTIQFRNVLPSALVEGAENKASTNDAVELTNGDRITGTLTGLNANGPLRLDSQGKQTEIPRVRLAAIKLSTDLARRAKDRDTFGRCVLKNGARISVRSATIEGVNFKGVTVVGPTVEVPLTELAAMNIHHGKAVYLSDLTPARYLHTPYLGVSWPFRNDCNVLGGPMCLNGDVFDKGVSAHSQCRIAYHLPSGSQRFECLVGLDDEIGKLGQASVEVLVDDVVLMPRKTLMPGKPAQDLRLELPAGARTITLVVNYDRGGDVQDHVNWANARIILRD